MKKNKIGHSPRTRKKIRWTVFSLFFYFLGVTGCGLGYMSVIEEEKIQAKIPRVLSPYSDALASNFKKSKKS